MGAGAMGHMETSMFEQCGYGREAIQARLERNWTEMFEGPDKIYWENDEGLGYVMDTGNHDVRTEGMSYAMMIAVQYDRKDVFDKLWGWVMKYMFMTEGLHKGYFAWSVDLSGVPNADGPAPDGEEYFAMALVPGLRALGRWRGPCTSTPATPARSCIPACTGARMARATRCGIRRTI